MRHRIKKIPNLIHHKINLLHSDKGAYDNNHENTNSSCSLNTLFFEARSRRLPSQGRAANPRRNSGPSSKKVFTGAARTYFYNNKLSGSSSMRNKLSSIPLLLSALVLLLVLGGLVFPNASSEVMAVGEDATEEESSGLTLSLDISSSTIGSNADGSAPAVADKPSYGSVTLTATATDINPLTGYSIYVQSTTSDTRLKNNIDDSNVIETITAAEGVLGENIPVNQWGYAIQRLNSADESVSYPTMTYKPVSASGVTSAPAEHGTDELNEVSYALAFGANIGSDKLAGHYRTNVLVSLVAEAKTMVTYSLNYNGNGNTGGTAPETVTVQSREDSYEFTVAGAGTLTKTNAEFLGWATTPGATTAEYTEGSKIKLTRKSNEAESTSSQTLYAVWKATTTPTTPVTNWADLQYMQQMSSEACANTSVNDTKQLIDSRDGKTYWVTKLKDNQCWMTQNLDLDLSTSKTLTTDDSNVTSNWTPTENTITTALNSTVWPNTNNIIRSWDPALGGVATYCNGGTTATAGKCKTSGNPTTSVNDGHDAQGNYYSWAAATAGTLGTSGSICPKGWQLPTSGNTNPKSFGGLTNGISAGSTLVGSPYYFVYSGYVYSDGLSYAGSGGYYWSSTAGNNDGACGLYFGSAGVYPSGVNYYGRYDGFPVRCVAQ